MNVKSFFAVDNNFKVLDVDNLPELIDELEDTLPDNIFINEIYEIEETITGDILYTE